MVQNAIAFVENCVFLEHENAGLRGEHLKKLHHEVKNQGFQAIVRRKMSTLVKATMKEAALLSLLDSLKNEHADLKQYLAEKTNN